MHRRTPGLNPARIDRDDEKRMLPCRNFLNGFCQRGSRCKFYHPNLSLREPFIRVPELPPNFTNIPQFGSSHELYNISSILDLNEISRPRNLRSGSRSSVTRTSPPVTPRNSKEMLPQQMLSPASLAYSEYMSLSQIKDEVDDDYRASKNRFDRNVKPQLQNTIFNHIDWSEFLVPGVDPPPPTLIPDQGAAISPVRDQHDMHAGLFHAQALGNRVLRPVLKMAYEDVPPEGSSDGNALDNDISLQSGPADGNKKLTAKEELQLKVKQIAKELAEEPIHHIRSLDSFFRNYKFGGFSVPVTPRTPPTPSRPSSVGEVDETGDSRVD